LTPFRTFSLTSIAVAVLSIGGASLLAYGQDASSFKPTHPQAEPSIGSLLTPAPPPPAYSRNAAQTPAAAMAAGAKSPLLTNPASAPLNPPAAKAPSAGSLHTQRDAQAVAAAAAAQARSTARTELLAALVAGLQKQIKAQEPQSSLPADLGKWTRAAVVASHVPGTTYSATNPADASPLPSAFFLRLPDQSGASDGQAVKARVDFTAGQWVLRLWGAREGQGSTLSDFSVASSRFNLAGHARFFDGDTPSLELPIANATPATIARLLGTPAPDGSQTASAATLTPPALAQAASAAVATASNPTAIAATNSENNAAASYGQWAPVHSVVSSLVMSLKKQEPQSLAANDLGAWESRALYQARGADLSMGTVAPSKFFIDWPKSSMGLSARVELSDGVWTLRIWSAENRSTPNLDALADAAQSWGLPQPARRAVQPMSVVSIPLMTATPAALAALDPSSPASAAAKNALAQSQGSVPAQSLAQLNQAARAQDNPAAAPGVQNASLSSPSAPWPADISKAPAIAALPAAQTAQPAATAALGPFLWASSIASVNFSANLPEPELARLWGAALTSVGLAGSVDSPFQATTPTVAAFRFTAFPNATVRLRRSPELGWGAQIEANRQDCAPILAALNNVSGSKVVDGSSLAGEPRCGKAAVTWVFVPFATGRGITLAGAAQQNPTQQTPVVDLPTPKSVPPQDTRAAGARALASAIASGFASAQTSNAGNAKALSELATLKSMNGGADPVVSAPAATKPSVAVATAQKTASAATQIAMAAPSATLAPVALQVAESATAVAAPSKGSALKLPQGVPSFAPSMGPAPAPLYWPGQQAAAFPRELYDDHNASDSDSDQAVRSRHAQQRMAWMAKNGGGSAGALFPGLK